MKPKKIHKRVIYPRNVQLREILDEDVLAAEEMKPLMIKGRLETNEQLAGQHM